MSDEFLEGEVSATSESSLGDLDRRLSHAGPPLEDEIGEKTAVLDHIPFDQPYDKQLDHVRAASTDAAEQGATKLEYFLPNEFAANEGIRDGDLLRLGFHKSDQQWTTGTAWNKPVTA